VIKPPSVSEKHYNVPCPVLQEVKINNWMYMETSKEKPDTDVTKIGFYEALEVTGCCKNATVVI
jgi:hypothetical protein